MNIELNNMATRRIDMMTPDEREHVYEIIRAEARIVKHFKGDLYLITSFSQDTESQDIMVNYVALYGDCVQYSRKMTMFAQEVDKEKWPNATQKFRFEPIVINSNKAKFERERKEMEC